MGKRSDRDAFFDVVAAFAEDVTRGSDAELLAEVAEDYGNPYALSEEFDKIVNSISSAQERNAGAQTLLQFDEQEALLVGLKRYLTNVSATLGQDLRKLLLIDESFRTRLSLMLEEMSRQAGCYRLPHAVAASDGNLHERRFEGGLLRLAESQKDRQQVYVIIELDNPSAYPRALILSGPDGDVAKLLLEAPDDDGVVQILPTHSTMRKGAFSNYSAVH